MSEPIWNQFLTERDKAVFAASGYGARGGFGKRPALLVIDVNYAFCGDKSEPILESIKRWRNSCGEESWPAVAAIRSLIDKAHEKGIRSSIPPASGARTIGTRVRGPGRNDRNEEDRTVPVSNVDGNQIVEGNRACSAGHRHSQAKAIRLFRNQYDELPTLLGCDSVIVTGTTTSGCVRATVLDAFSLNYRIALAEEGCFDRSQASHAINLCDMNAKYADVVKTDEVLDLFRLPAGRHV